MLPTTDREENSAGTDIFLMAGNPYSPQEVHKATSAKRSTLGYIIGAILIPIGLFIALNGAFGVSVSIAFKLSSWHVFVCTARTLCGLGGTVAGIAFLLYHIRLGACITGAAFLAYVACDLVIDL